MEKAEFDPHRLRLTEKLCVSFTAICVLLSIIVGYVIADVDVFGTLARGDADGLGMGLFALLVLMISVPALVIATVLGALATRLPWGFRILAVLPALAGVVVGIAIWVTLSLQGK